MSTVQQQSTPLTIIDHGKASDGAILEELTEEDEEVGNQVLFEVYHAVMNKDLVLPSLPDVALRIRDTANNENASVEDVARVIQADASTAAYCISIANNAAHAGKKEIENVLDAVVRMGIQPTRDIVVSYTLRSLFAGQCPVSKKLMREAWKHSCRIAALGYILARDVARLNPERGLLAGLLHDVGVTVLINQAQDHPELLKDLNAFNKLCHELSGQIGAMVLRAWKFPDAITTATLDAESFDKPVAERLSISDVVMLAHLHDEQPAPWSITAVDLAELPIYAKLGECALTEDHRLAVVEEADRELAELTKLLSR